MEEPLQTLATSKCKNWPPIFEGLSDQQNVTAPTADLSTLNLQEETRTGGDALVHDMAKETPFGRRREKN